MGKRQRATNRRRSRANNTDIDVFDAAVSKMIGQDNNTNAVKMVVDPSEERRFTLVGENLFANKSLDNDCPIDMYGQETQTTDFSKHQVNYSATKYIKPWRTGTKSQQLPPKAGHEKNSGKGGK